MTTPGPVSLLNVSFEEEFGQWSNSSASDLTELFTTFMKFNQIMNVFKDVFLGGMVIVLESFALYLFCRFKKLRSNLNMYIFNLCCIDLLSQIKAFVDFVLMETINPDGVDLPLFCSFVQLYKMILVLYFTVCFCLALDWFMSCIRPYLFENRSNYRGYFIVALNLVVFVFYIIAIMTHCVGRDVIFLGWAENLIYTQYLLILIGIMILYAVIRRLDLKRSYTNNSHIFDIAVVIILAFLPMIAYHFVIIYFELNLLIELILLYSLFIPQIIAHLHFVIVLVILYKKDLDVRNVFVRHFKVLEDFNDDQKLSSNMDNESTYVHADDLGSVEDTRRLSAF